MRITLYAVALLQAASYSNAVCLSELSQELQVEGLSQTDSESMTLLGALSKVMSNMESEERQAGDAPAGGKPWVLPHASGVDYRSDKTTKQHGMNVCITTPNYEHTNVFLPTDRKDTIHVKKTAGIKVYDPKPTEKSVIAQKAINDRIKGQLLATSLKGDSSDESADSGDESDKVKNATKSIMSQMNGDKKHDKNKVTTQKKVDDMILAQ